MQASVKSKQYRALLAVVAVVAVGTSAQAKLIVSDATYTGSFSTGTPEAITGAATLASITTTEGTLLNLFGATANNVVTSNAISSILSPAPTADVAASGLSVNDGINNLQSGNFQFGTSFTANTRFFIIESTPQSSTVGDPAEIRLIDASNAVVGTYLLTLVAGDFTASAANTTSTSLATVTYAAGQGNLVQKLGGVVFSLSDFTGTGSLASATGIRIVSPGAAGGAAILDTNVVGIATVPEPATLGVLSLAGLAILARRRGSRIV